MLIQGLITLVVIVLSHEIVFRDKELEIINKCIPKLDYIRKTKKDRYVVYQFMTDGRMFDLRMVENVLAGYIGKPVRVFFDRVLTVRVYHNGLPKEIGFDGVDCRGGIVIGMGLDGIVFHDFDKYPHMIIAGTTGYGKTNLIRGLLSQMQGKVTVLDLKADRRDYPVASARNIREAVWALESVSEGFVIVDEAAELLAPSFLTKKERRDYEYCQMIVSEIARMGRSRGIHLIYCTQYPTADVLPRQIKQNSECRVVFRTVTETASRVALDEGGAEKLGGVRGRCLYKTDCVEEIQTFLTNDRSVGDACIRTKEEKGVGRGVEIG